MYIPLSLRRRTHVLAMLWIFLLLAGLIFPMPVAAHPTADEPIYLPLIVAPNGPIAAEIPFPVDLALASPLKMVAAQGPAAAETDGAWTTGYDIATARLTAILSSTLPIAAVFDAQRFLTMSNDANCYGPRLRFHDHPDETPTPTSTLRELPTGDLGIWTTYELTATTPLTPLTPGPLLPSAVLTTTTDACSAAQLNSRLNAAEAQTQSALELMAALIAARRAAGLPVPTTTTTLNLTAQMNAAGISGVTFRTATIAYDAPTHTWTYSVDFDYGDGSSLSHHIVVAMTYTPDTATPLAVYRGALTYAATDQRVAPNCGGFSGGGPRPDVTVNGSFQFDHASATDLKIQSRSATFCGLDTTNFDAGQVDAIGVSPGDATDPQWTDNFSIFTANFNPSTLAGQYAYAWQAGYGDRASRVLNMEINNFEPLDGEAYFGYGRRLQDDADGSVPIEGIYCNWAAPGSLPTWQQYAQRQFVEFDSTTGYFVVLGEDIRYAPTNSCQFNGTTDGVTAGAFWYDRNLDGIENESPADVLVTPSSANPFDLLEPSDTDGDSIATILERITGRGYTLPTAP